MRVFEAVIAVDGNEVKLPGRGNRPISGLATALKNLGIDLYVHDYKEHAIGAGHNVKAASYIECKVSGGEQSVLGVGIHGDTMQSSLIAMLSAASNLVASLPSNSIL